MNQFERAFGLVFRHLHQKPAGSEGKSLDGTGRDFIFDIDHEIIGFQTRPDQIGIRRIEGGINSDEIHKHNIRPEQEKLKS